MGGADVGLSVEMAVADVFSLRLVAVCLLAESPLLSTLKPSRAGIRESMVFLVVVLWS